MKRMNLMLFLGSGVSFPSELPNAAGITESLLNGDRFMDTDERFYRGPHPNPASEREPWVPRLQAFLRLLKDHADRYYATRSEPESNYEDLYSLSQQIHYAENGEIYNPALEPFLLDVQAKTIDLRRPFNGERKEIDLREMARRACIFINCLVAERLSLKKEPCGLDLVRDLARTSEVTRLDIFTLNHDVVMEDFLHNEGIPFTDGFGHPDGTSEVCYFEPDSYDRDFKVRIFKLHGSVNWYRFRIEEHGKWIISFAIPVNGGPYFWKDSNGRRLERLDAMPVLLIGRENKILDYGSNIFSEMHFRFHLALQQHDTVVVSGYGWHDRAINTRLFEWVMSSLDKRLFLLYEGQEKLRQSCGEMRERYDRLVNEKRFIPLRKYLCDVSLDRMLPLLRRQQTEAPE